MAQSYSNRDWYVDSRGYIHYGFGLPIFEEAKRRHNTRVSRRRQHEKIVARIAKEAK